MSKGQPFNTFAALIVIAVLSAVSEPLGFLALIVVAIMWISRQPEK